MKRMCLGLMLSVLCGVVVLSSCKKNNNPNGAKGRIILTSYLDMDVNNITRATSVLEDFSGYILTISQGSNIVYKSGMPQDGIVEVPEGTYTVGLSNMDGFVPAFEDSRYEGSENNIKVVADESTPVTLTLGQANAGVNFIYDPSLAVLGEVVPFIAQGSNSLSYESNRDGVGYFSPGEILMSFKVGDEFININGSQTVKRVLEAADMLEITLKATSTASGLSFTVVINDVVNNKIETINLGDSSVDGGGFMVEGLANTQIVMTFTNGTQETMELDANGKVDLSKHANAMIESIKPEGMQLIYIGRRADEAVRLKILGRDLVLRDADDEGFIPIGTYAELNLINDHLSDNYKQEANIDMLNISFKPIAYNKYGSSDNQFSGIYDGAGFSISNLTVIANGVNFTGMFGWNNGTVKNIRIESGNITSDKGVVGGIVGNNDENGLVEFCINKASVKAHLADMIGGVVGRNYGTIQFCGNEGDVDGGDDVAGVCGINGPDAMTNALVLGCYNKTDNIIAQGNVGGIVGENNAQVIASYNIGDLLQGHPNNIGAGGVVGANHGVKALIYACYSVGDVAGMKTKSGGVTDNFNGSIYDCYWAGCDRPGGQYGPGDYIVFYLNNGSTAPNGYTPAWPASDGSKHWGLVGNNGGNPAFIDVNDISKGGYWWKDLGTESTNRYPVLWWE